MEKMITKSFMAKALEITTWLNPNHPPMAHLVACNYPKCSCKCNHKLGFHIILRIIHGNG